MRGYLFYIEVCRIEPLSMLSEGWYAGKGRGGCTRVEGMWYVYGVIVGWSQVVFSLWIQTMCGKKKAIILTTELRREAKT